MNILKYKMNTKESKLDKLITNYSNDMKTLIDKLNTLNTSCTDVHNHYSNETDCNYRKRMSSLLIKSNSNPIDSTYHLRNFNSNSINEFKELVNDKAQSLNGNGKMSHSLQDYELFE